MNTRLLSLLLALLLLASLCGCGVREPEGAKDAALSSPEGTAPQTAPESAKSTSTVLPETDPDPSAEDPTENPDDGDREDGAEDGKDQAGQSVALPEEPFVYKGLVELASVDDSFIIDQRYATENNFTGVVHYDRVLCLVNEDVLPMLIAANDAAKAEGYRIKIWDAYRPISVQQALHDAAPPELSAYVPGPSPYSMHARGITVDVTLCDMDGNELDMPTGFDDSSERAHSDYAGATAEQIANRELLNRFMSAAGFRRSSLEWWHFDGPNRDRYEILDVSFAEFESARDGGRSE